MYKQPEIRHVRAHVQGKWGTQIIRSLCGKTGKLVDQSSEANCGACTQELKKMTPGTAAVELELDWEMMP